MLSKNRQTSGVDWKLRSTEFGGWPMSENTPAEAQRRWWKARAQALLAEMPAIGSMTHILPGISHIKQKLSAQ